MILYYIFVLSLPFVDHPLFGIGFGGITVEKAWAAATLLYSVVHLATRHPMPLFLDTGPARAFLLYFVLVLLSYAVFGGPGPSDTLATPLPFNFLMLFFMTIAVVDSVSRLRWALLAAVGSVAWASLYMLRDWQVGSAIYGSSYRPGFVVGDPNYFAASALLCLPLAFYFARFRSNRWTRLCCAGAVLVTLAAIAASSSRGGVFGLVSLTVLMALRSKQRVGSLIVMGTLLGAFLVLMPTSGLDRLLHPTSSDDAAKEARLTTWNAAWRMFQDNPLTGVGYGRFRDYAPRYVDSDVTTRHLVHNQYLEVLSEMGLPGLMVYLGIYIASYVTLRRVQTAARRVGSRFLADAASGIQIGLVGYSVAVFFLSANFLRPFWFMVAIAACMPALVPTAHPAERIRRRLKETTQGALTEERLAR